MVDHNEDRDRVQADPLCPSAAGQHSSQEMFHAVRGSRLVAHCVYSGQNTGKVATELEVRNRTRDPNHVDCDTH
eukprot:6001336-Amphidinium_carterae.1